MEFVGRATPLSQVGVAVTLDRLAAQPEALWAVLKVETSGCGFDPDRRPRILFERHIFHRRTDGRFDAAAPDVSAGTTGGYGAAGAHQYERLHRAMELDQRAALESASWGIGQVMGFHASTLGYADVQSMVHAMTGSEDVQLKAMADFAVANDLHHALQRHDWEEFARRYNGAGFRQNAYDTKLAGAFARYRERGVPDLDVRAAQVFLTYRGFVPGPIDGEIGSRTRDALSLFQQGAGLPATGNLDRETLTALADLPPP